MTHSCFYPHTTYSLIKTSVGVSVLSCLTVTPSVGQTYEGKGSPNFLPHTLREAMASAYLTNPQLREQRAQLRAVDEQMPAAMAGWRPTINGSFGLAYLKGNSTTSQQVNIGGQNIEVPSSQKYNSSGYNGGVTLNQPLYQGGRTIAGIRVAKNQILAERARLIATEQQVLLAVVNAYVEVVQDDQLLQAQMNNERVLGQQAHTAQRRFRLGEISRTDVAQAQGALASASSQRQQAEGVLKEAQATYLQVVGVPAVPDLVPPQPLNVPIKNEQDAIAMAVHNNPNVISALFTEAQQKNNVSVQMSAILPKVSASLGYQNTRNYGTGATTQDSKTANLALQIPIYQGGGEYAGIRQARQSAEAAHHDVDVQRRQALQQASANWQSLLTSQETLKSSRLAVSANTAALAGVERQALVGTASTLVVLQQQQTLLMAQESLIQNISSLVNSSYMIAAAIGRLTAVDLKLPVPLYDEKAYYKAVKNRLWGISDYAVNQPGR